MKKPLRYDDAVGDFALCREGCCNKKHRAKTERFQNRYLIRLLQLSAAGEVFLEGTCPLSRCPQTAKFPVPILLGTRRRWVRKATAFRGRSEQDRSALCAVCSTDILKTFQWNVFNRTRISRDTACRVRQNPKQPQKGCANVDAALLEFMVEMENRIMPQPELPSSKMQSSPPALLPPPASSNEHGSRPAAILRIPQR